MQVEASLCKIRQPLWPLGKWSNLEAHALGHLIHQQPMGSHVDLSLQIRRMCMIHGIWEATTRAELSISRLKKKAFVLVGVNKTRWCIHHTSFSYIFKQLPLPYGKPRRDVRRPANAINRRGSWKATKRGCDWCAAVWGNQFAHCGSSMLLGELNLVSFAKRNITGRVPTCALDLLVQLESWIWFWPSCRNHERRPPFRAGFGASKEDFDFHSPPLLAHHHRRDPPTKIGCSCRQSKMDWVL